MTSVLIREHVGKLDDVLQRLRQAYGADLSDRGDATFAVKAANGGSGVVTIHVTQKHADETTPLLSVDFNFDQMSDEEARAFIDQYDRRMEEADRRKAS